MLKWKAAPPMSTCYWFGSYEALEQDDRPMIQHGEAERTYHSCSKLMYHFGISSYLGTMWQ